MPKLQLLHINFYTYLRQVVFLLLERDNGLVTPIIAFVSVLVAPLVVDLRTIQLVQEVLHVFDWEAREVVYLQFYDLGYIANQLDAVFGVLLKPLVSVVEIADVLLAWKLLFNLSHLNLVFKHF